MEQIHQEGYGVCTTYFNGDKAIRVGKNVSPERLNKVATVKSRCNKENHQKSTLTHEFGHAIYTSGTSKSNPKFWNKIETLHKAYINECSKCKIDSDEYKQLFLGNYAKKTTTEFLAEAFQEYKNYSNPSNMQQRWGN